MAIGLWSMSEVVPLHVISWSRDFTWNGLILGISRDHGMKITWNHVIFTWNQALGISWFHVMRKFHAQYVSGRLSKTVKFLDGLTQNYAKFFEVKKQMRQKWAKNFQNVFVTISQDWMRLEAKFKKSQNRLFMLVKMHWSDLEKSHLGGRGSPKSWSQTWHVNSRTDRARTKIPPVLKSYCKIR